MSKKLITELPVECKICRRDFKKLEGLSKHLNLVHDTNPISYTKEYLLNDEVPKCQCGCGKDTMVYNYRYNEWHKGHTGGGNWHLMYDKDSPEYLEIISKISNSVKEYQKDNPVVISEEQRKQQSEYMKNLYLNNRDEFERRSLKMTETKRRQSKEGILSERHWTKVRGAGEVLSILKENGRKISKTKLKRFKSGELSAWNKGLNKFIDDRIANYSGKNHYRWTSSKKLEYGGLFRCVEYRTLLSEMQDDICFICRDVPNGKALCLHHVDGDAKNNSFNNLIFLCRSCHTKLHNDRMYRDNVDLMIFYFKEELKNDIRLLEFNKKYIIENN